MFEDVSTLTGSARLNNLDTDVRARTSFEMKKPAPTKVGAGFLLASNLIKSGLLGAGSPVRVFPSCRPSCPYYCCHSAVAAFPWAGRQPSEGSPWVGACLPLFSGQRPPSRASSLSPQPVIFASSRTSFFPILLMYLLSAHGRESRDAPASIEQERCQKPVYPNLVFKPDKHGHSTAWTHRLAPFRTVSCTWQPGQLRPLLQFTAPCAGSAS